VKSSDLDRLARTAYEAHRGTQPGSLPTWEDSTEQEQQAWRAAVTAVTSQDSVRIGHTTVTVVSV
jgi:hypothetical protein